MKKLKSGFWEMVLSLTLISALVAIMLGFSYIKTSVLVSDLAEKNRRDGILEVVVPNNINSSDYFIGESELIDESTLYNVYAISDSSLVGTAVVSSDNGFGGNLTIMFGFDTTGVITGYKVLEHSETPGLGAQVTDWFKRGTGVSSSGGYSYERKKTVMNFLFGKSAASAHNIIGLDMSAGKASLSKDGGTIDAITASTITSRAFMRALKKSYSAVNPNAAVDAATGATGSAADAETGATTVASDDSAQQPTLTFERKKRFLRR